MPSGFVARVLVFEVGGEQMDWSMLIASLTAFYVVLGVFFAGFFLYAGISKIDHSVRGSHWGFFALVVPGLVVLWPVMLSKWVRALRRPDR